MKKQVLFLLLIFMLASCAPAVVTPAVPVPTTVEMIEPGDTLGDMSFRIAKSRRDWGITFMSFCDVIVPDAPQGVFVEDCELPQLGRVFIGYGVGGETRDDVNKVWPTLSWEMYFDDQPVNLAAFGTIDDSYAGLKFRYWNVVLMKPAVGAHTLRFLVHPVDAPDEVTEMIWQITVK